MGIGRRADCPAVLPNGRHQALRWSAALFAARRRVGHMPC
jgi:hypothetical protein